MRLQKSPNLSTVTIRSDLTADRLIAAVKAVEVRRRIEVRYFESDLAALVSRDLEILRGRELQAFVSGYDREWTTPELRTLQRSQHADGNAAGLLAWIIEAEPIGALGVWTSIANTDDRLVRTTCRPNTRVTFCAPFFRRGVDDCSFGLNGTHFGWDKAFQAVSFRVRKSHE